MKCVEPLSIGRRLLAAVVVVLVPAFGPAALASGGFTIISQLTPYASPPRTPRISGIAFDNQANPWVIDGLSWQMQRLNESTGAVLQTYTPTIPADYCESLTWSAANGDFYTGSQSEFYNININTGTCTTIGPFQLFNFMELAFGPSGSLWLGVDDNGPQLWSVNAATGVPTFDEAITGLAVNQQLHAFTIDSGTILPRLLGLGRQPHLQPQSPDRRGIVGVRVER